MLDAPDQVVVLRYRDGYTVRGTLNGRIPPSAAKIELRAENGDLVSADLRELKAVFFLKDPRTRSAELELGRVECEVPDSALARVEFVDGEVISGRVQRFSVADRGFFLYPSAAESNNERVFVIASAVTSVDITG